MTPQARKEPKKDENMELGLVDTAWLAGILEGEGCFSCQMVNKGKDSAPRITLVMTDRDIVERVCQMVGTRIVGAGRPTCPTYKTAYRTYICGSKARAIMRSIRPFMGTRRGKKIDEILAIWDMRHFC